MEELKNEQIIQILLSVADPDESCASNKYCQVLFASQLVEHVVAQRPDLLPEVVALCCSFDGLYCVQQHLLACILKCQDCSEALEEQLSIALKYKLLNSSSKHQLVALIKCISSIKEKRRNQVLSQLDGSIWECTHSYSNLKLDIEVCALLHRLFFLFLNLI
jgi:hypothetical protein